MSAGDDAPPVAAESPTEAADPARAPRTAEDARALVRSVINDERTVGNAARRGTPHQSDPATWAVLGGDCGWRRAALPGDVLANLRRDFELPGGGDVPGLRLTAEVTVHSTELDAAREQARMAEEAMACPRQIPPAGEELSDLTSTLDPTRATFLHGTTQGRLRFPGSRRSARMRLEDPAVSGAGERDTRDDVKGA